MSIIIMEICALYFSTITGILPMVNNVVVLDY
jgi:hypothetical protein